MSKLAGKWIESSAALAGSPTTTTQSANDNSTKIATTAYADASSSTAAATVQGNLASHMAASSAHGVAGAIVGTTDSQALTNKTIDASLNTLSNIANSMVAAGAAIAESKLALDHSTASLSTSTATVAGNLATHLADLANPHQVTKAQVLTGNLIVNADVDAAAAIVESKLSLDHSTASLYSSVGSASAAASAAQSQLNHVQTLTGVASGSDNMGAFTGTHLSSSETIKTALQSLSDAITTASNSPSAKQEITLSGTDITNQYIDLAHVIVPGSLMVTPVGGPLQMEGTDYTLSQPGAVTRVTFAGDMATILVATDKVEFKYEY